MRHFEQSLAAAQSLPLEPAGRLEMIALDDDVVLGYAFRTAMESVEWGDRTPRTACSQLPAGELPRLAALLADGPGWDELIDEGDGRSERGLEALLDGIARRLAA